MPNQNFRNHFQIAVSNALEKQKAVSTIDHAGLRGKSREIFLSDLLKPVLLPGMGIGTGKIVDSEGNKSSECDLIVYNKTILPPIMFDESMGLFPVEACLCAIEVKSVLTASEVDDAISKFARLSKLHPIKEGERPVHILFGFSSDLTEDGKTELERYKERSLRTNEGCFVKVICVPGRGYFYFDGKKSKWDIEKGKSNFQETVNFIAHFSNSIAQLSRDRGTVNFGRYIVDLP